MQAHRNTLHKANKHADSIVYTKTDSLDLKHSCSYSQCNKTGRLTNGTTHSLFITHHLHKQTLHARTLFSSRPTHCSLAATSGGLFLVSLPGHGLYLLRTHHQKYFTSQMLDFLAVSPPTQPHPSVFNQHVNKRKVIFFLKRSGGDKRSMA